MGLKVIKLVEKSLIFQFLMLLKCLKHKIFCYFVEIT